VLAHGKKYHNSDILFTKIENNSKIYKYLYMISVRIILLFTSLAKIVSSFVYNF